MTEMFFQVLFIIVICLGIFLCASWFFSCLYTEWQLDAAERARKKQEEELQVVKEQDPDGTEETNFIEETSITIDDVQQNKKNKKQNFVQMSDATLPSNQMLCSVYSQGTHMQGNDNAVNSKKNNKMTSSQKKQQQQFQQMQLQQQQYAAMQQDMQQQHQLKQMQQAAQQRQIEQIKQQFPNLKPADLRHLEQLQANLNNNNLNNSTSNSVSINLTSNNNSTNNTINPVVQKQQQQQISTAAEIPSTVIDAVPSSTVVEIIAEPAEVKPQAQLIEQQVPVVPIPKATTTNFETVTAEIEKDILPEIIQPTQSVPQQQQQHQLPQQANNQSNQPPVQPVVSVLSDEEIIKELNLADKLPYRERKLEEYEFFKTALEIFDLSRNLESDEMTESYANQFENAINEADAKRSKIDWQLVPLLHATDHITAIEEITVLLDQFLKSKFFKKINRQDKNKVIDQLLRSVLNIITKRLKFPAKRQDHQEDLLWIWNEIKDTLEAEKMRIKTPKLVNPSNKPKPPPKPQKFKATSPDGFMNV